MPDDVMARIQGALAQEQQTRSVTPANVAPLVGRAGRSGSGDGATVAPESRSRRRWLAPVAGLGAAAAIAVGALGISNAMNDDDPTAPVAGPPTSSSPGVPSGPTPSAPSTGAEGDRLSIQVSDRNYTAAGLSSEAVALKSQRGVIDPTRAESIGLGPVATVPGLLGCLKTVGATAVTADRVTADLARYEGSPAVVVVITDDGRSTAWVLSRTCSQGGAKIAGPTSVA